MNVNKLYSMIEGKSFSDLEVELKAIYQKYDEYDTFDKMVKKFANDDFYNLHYVVQ